MIAMDECYPRLLAELHELRGVAADDVQSFRIAERGSRPICLLPRIGAPVDVRAREEIRPILLHECRFAWGTAADCKAPPVPRWRNGIRTVMATVFLLCDLAQSCFGSMAWISARSCAR